MFGEILPVEASKKKHQKTKIFSKFSEWAKSGDRLIPKKKNKFPFRFGV